MKYHIFEMLSGVIKIHVCIFQFKQIAKWVGYYSLHPFLSYTEMLWGVVPGFCYPLLEAMPKGESILLGKIMAEKLDLQELLREAIQHQPWREPVRTDPPSAGRTGSRQKPIRPDGTVNWLGYFIQEAILSEAGGIIFPILTPKASLFSQSLFLFTLWNVKPRWPPWVEYQFDWCKVTKSLLVSCSSGSHEPITNVLWKTLPSLPVKFVSVIFPVTQH